MDGKMHKLQKVNMYYNEHLIANVYFNIQFKDKNNKPKNSNSKLASADTKQNDE